MNENHQQFLDKVFMALADASRRKIVHLLSKQELSMNDVAEHFDMSLAAVSKHVKVLERAGLIKRRKEGRTHHLSLSAEPLTEALDWISIYRNFWQSRLNTLANIEPKED